MSRRQKIVVARYRLIGDSILSIPFLRALRRQNPQAEIHLLIGDDAISLMAHCPYVDKVITFEPRKLGYWQAMRLVRRERYDVAYILKRSLSSAMMMFLAGIPERIGFDTEGRGFLLTQRVPYRPKEQHEAQCYLDLLPKSDSPPDMALALWLPEEVQESAAKRISGVKRPRITLHATSSKPAKCWPITHFATLAQMLIETYDAQLYCFGTADERALYDAMIAALPEARRANVNNLCGETSLIGTMGILPHMDLVVANDSGMIHMAAMADVPVVCLFGPMDPNQWHPLSQRVTILTNPDLDCRPCRMKITCGNRFPCLTEIAPQQVFTACKPYLIS